MVRPSGIRLRGSTRNSVWTRECEDSCAGDRLRLHQLPVSRQGTVWLQQPCGLLSVPSLIVRQIVQIQSMWTESMWSKWNPNWSLYLSKPLFSG